MSDRIWIWFADNGNIRKWQHEPFPEGTEYVVAAQADAELEEMPRSCLAERAGAASLRSKLEEAEGARGSALVATPPSVPVAFRVHDFHIARSPVKARGLFPEVTEYLYPANREQDAKDIARTLGGEFQPLYAAPRSTPPAEPVVEARNYETFRTFAHEATKAITNLTGGGSEYFGKEVDGVFLADLPRCVERLRDRIARAALATKPVIKDDEAVVEALTDDAIRAYVKDRSIYLRESASVPDVQNGGWKHPFSLTITGDELRQMVAALAAKPAVKVDAQ